MIMNDEDVRILWRSIIVMRSVLSWAGGKAKITGEGDYITLSAQILREDGRKTYFTNIVYCFAGTIRLAGSYVVAKLICRMFDNQLEEV